MGIISGLLSMFGWGTSDFFAAKSSRKIGYMPTYFWTQLVTLAVALIYFLLKFPAININSASQFLIFLIPAGFLFMVATIAFYRGFVRGQVSLVSPIGSSWSMIVVILSMIFLNEVLKIHQIIAVILIILGIVLVSINLQELFKIKKLSLLTGTKEGIIAMLGWGISLFLIGIASKTIGWFLPVFILKIVGISVLIIYTLFGRQSIKTSFQPPILFLILMVGILDIIAFFSYSFGVEREYASIVAPIAASFPLITVILARIFLKEKLVLNQNLGIVSVIGGLILISI
ncbi:DMT family transporter [Candidatus Parcubacteria bacterium]|nr:DMT family transporter [Candidatus Parcubacteria bacterium]